MLQLTDRMRRELTQTADELIPIETRLVVEIPDDDVWSLIQHWAENGVPLTWETLDSGTAYAKIKSTGLHADEIGWDLFRLGQKSECGHDNFANLLLVTDDEGYRDNKRIGVQSDDDHESADVLTARAEWDQYVSQRFRSFDRPRQNGDLLLIDLMDDARHDGWTPSQAIDTALAELQVIADERRDELEDNYQITSHRDRDKMMRVENLPAPPPPSNSISTINGIPMLAGQQVVADLGAPILDGFVSGHQGKPAADYPHVPDVMKAHPLSSSINAAIGLVVGAAERSPSAFRAAGVTDVLAVISNVHADTAAAVVARLRGMGCILPDGKLNTAARAFEANVTRTLRSGNGWRITIKGDPDPQNADNVCVLLSYLKVAARFNVWRQRAELQWDGGAWMPLTDAELNRLRSIASREEYRFRPSKEFFRDMLFDVARQTSFDPVLDWIDGAVWDGVPRLSKWLSQTCAVPPDPYHEAISRNVIGGLVKRARSPGAKHDEVMILIGAQGCGKSELTKALALTPEWHTDSITFEGRPQDIIPQLFGRLVVELSELDGVHRKDVGYIKRFLSTQTDNYTAKYEALATDHARRCIFIGTCNLENPLVDDTGNRRFYPVRIPDGHQVDVAWLRANLSQIIGEAASLEAAGETFSIPPAVWADAARVQETARTVSAVEELLLQWFSKPTVAGTAGFYVLSGDMVLALTMARQNANAKVGRVMERMGYRHLRPYVGGVQVRAWVKSTTGEISNCVQLLPTQANSGAVEMRMKLNVT